MTMTIDEHKAKFREILNMVEGVFMKDGEVHPVVFTVKDGGLCVYMVASIKDAKEKDALAEFMTKLVRDGAEAIIFVSESWSLRQEDAETYKDYSSIEANPKRIEIISAIYSFKDNDMMASAEIDRDYDRS